MFERFTDRARRVLVLAQEEARLLNHGFIGTEHILLGLLREQEGVAARVLQELDVSLAEARERVEEAIGVSGTAPSGSPPFTPRAKKVLELALREALQLGHNYIGTEHILLGLVREGEGVAAHVLVGMGADLATVRTLVLQTVEASGGVGPIRRAMGWGGGGVGRARSALVRCSFCGDPPPQSGRLVAGRGAFICERCVATWAERLGDEPPGEDRVVSELYEPPEESDPGG